MKINRKEKQYRGSECLNCEHPLDISDKYCSNCGQLNSTKKLTLKDFIEEFFGNFYAYDSRLRNSIISIFTKPGQLAKEFINGKRQHYANPFRLFLSVAIVSFILPNEFNTFAPTITSKPKTETVKNQHTKEEKINFSLDSIYTKEELLKAKNLNLKYNISSFRNNHIKYPTETPEVALKKLGYEPSFLGVWFYKKCQSFQTNEFTYELKNYLLGKLPLFIFLSLPFLTLMFWLVSFRRFSYTDNLVFTYTFFTFFFVVNILVESTSYVSTLVYELLSMFVFPVLYVVYSYKSLQTFYDLNRKKTIFKFIFLNVLFVPFFIITLLFIIFMGAILF